MKPPLKSDEIEFIWEDEGKQLECVLFYQPEERGTLTEPGCGAYAELERAYLGDHEISDWLSNLVRWQIQAAAILHFSDIH